MPWCGETNSAAHFLHADGFYFFSNAHAFEKRHIGRQQGFADMEARVARFFQQHNPVTLFDQQWRNRRAGWPAANHQHITTGDIETMLSTCNSGLRKGCRPTGCKAGVVQQGFRPTDCWRGCLAKSRLASSSCSLLALK
jgi:hypothetical protein